MTREEAIKTIIEYFQENETEYDETIEELDSYNGYLGDDRYYGMEELDELYNGTEPTEILTRAFYGYDADTWYTDSYGEKHYGPFNPNREYFTYNGYGNLVSSDYKDYSYKLDSWFVESLIDNAGQLWNIPEEVQEIIESIEE